MLRLEWAVAKVPQQKLLPCLGHERKIQAISREALGERRGEGCKQISHPLISPPPGGPCSHHESGQPSTVHVCQGDRWLRNAQGQGVYVPIPVHPWAQPSCSITVSAPIPTIFPESFSCHPVNNLGWAHSQQLGAGSSAVGVDLNLRCLEWQAFSSLSHRPRPWCSIWRSLSPK